MGQVTGLRDALDLLGSAVRCDASIYRLMELSSNNLQFSRPRLRSASPWHLDFPGELFPLGLGHP